MRRISTIVTFWLGMFAATSAFAAGLRPVTTMTCADTGGGTLKADVFAYTLSADDNATRYMTTYVKIAQLDTMLYAEYFGSGFDSCSFSGALGVLRPSSLKIVDVTASGVGSATDVTVDGVSGAGQQFAAVTFSYEFLEIGLTPTNARALKVITPEEKAKALAAFKARGLVLPR